MHLIHPTFFIIVALFNPSLYERRYELHRQFEGYISKFGATMITVELVFNNESFRVTQTNNPNHIQLKTNDYLWYKENLINIAIKRLPDHCEYVAWVDGDLEFLNPNWIYDTIDALEIYNIVQLFHEAHFLGPKNETHRIDMSFGFGYATNQPFHPKASKPYRLFFKEDEVMIKDQYVINPYINDDEKQNGLNEPYFSEVNKSYSLNTCSHDQHDNYQKYFNKRIIYQNNNNQADGKKDCVYWHPGYAWAAKKTTLLKIGGLFDMSIVGCGDKIMSMALIGRTIDSLPFNVAKSYKDVSLRWEANAERVVKRKVGYIKNTILHYWHGLRKNRNYWHRQIILTSSEFDPLLDVYYDDVTGLMKIRSNKKKEYYQSAMKDLFEKRKEDTLDVKTIPQS